MLVQTGDVQLLVLVCEEKGETLWLAEEIKVRAVRMGRRKRCRGGTKEEMFGWVKERKKKSYVHTQMVWYSCTKIQLYKRW